MTEGLEIRPARFGEEREVLEMYEWLFEPPGSRPAGFDPSRALARIAETITERDSVILVAVESGRRVGLCSVYLDLDSVRYGQRAWIEDLVVSPDRRSAGIGRALLDAARTWGRERKATHLELDSGEARDDAHRFYERQRPDWEGRQYAWRLER
jgi:GNAT superfamily N-acetyltransferase